MRKLFRTTLNLGHSWQSKGFSIENSFAMKFVLFATENAVILDNTIEDHLGVTEKRTR